VIKVLQSWQEIGEAILGLQRLGLPLHLTPQKNWDHWLLYNALAQVVRTSAMADLGCGEGHTLRVLHALGFESIDGVDFKIAPELRVRQALTMYRDRTWRRPYRLHRGNILSTPLEGAAYGCVASISMIEHGCNLPQFFRESARLLRDDGLLFVTTDYWDDKIDTSDARPAFGLPWRIFCREEIHELIGIAGEAGLRPSSDAEIQTCSERPIYWNNRSYTFIAMSFRHSD
jgi:SAM-dependent methyltransferase